jgi:hypothetical protein
MIVLPLLWMWFLNLSLRVQPLFNFQYLGSELWCALHKVCFSGHYFQSIYGIKAVLSPWKTCLHLSFIYLSIDRIMHSVNIYLALLMGQVELSL